MFFSATGEISYVFMKDILLKLANFMTCAADMSEKHHVSVEKVLTRYRLYVILIMGLKLLIL